MSQKEHVVVSNLLVYRGSSPSTVDTKYYCDMTDEQPYVRYFALESSAGWAPLDTGWVDGPALLHVRCDTVRDQALMVMHDPAPERMTDADVEAAQERTARLREIAEEAKRTYLEFAVDGLPFAQLPQGRDLTLHTVPGAQYTVRTVGQKLKVALHAFPREV